MLTFLSVSAGTNLSARRQSSNCFFTYNDVGHYYLTYMDVQKLILALLTHPFVTSAPKKQSCCVRNWKTTQLTVWGKIKHPPQKWRIWGWCGRNERARLPLCPEIIIPKPKGIVVRTVQQNDLKPNSDVCYLARSQQLASPNLNIPHLLCFFGSWATLDLTCFKLTWWRGDS